MQGELIYIALKADDLLLDFALEYSIDYGWMAGLKQGDQFVKAVSGWHAELEEAVHDLYDIFKSGVVRAD